MAATSIGLPGLAFGLSQETGVVVQNFTSTHTSETTEIPKHNGTLAAVAFSAFKQNVSISGNCKNSIDSVGASLTLAANAGAVSSGNYYVTSSNYTQTADGFNAFDISATKYIGLNT